MASLVGQTLVSRYEILDLLGRGGMGEVYRARDRELDELVALKLVAADLLTSSDARARLRNEVKLARRVTHRNVARAYELVITAELAFYTMELVDGRSLAHRGRLRLPVLEAGAIVAAVCDALSAAHVAGVIHRDVKPANILLAGDGRVVLADFGIAAAVRGDRDIAGTPLYMAPEQAAGDEPTPAADVYSLGVVLYELVTGAEPAATVPRIDPARLAGLDPRLGHAITRATAATAAERYDTAATFRRALAPFVPTRADTSPEPVEPSMRASPVPTVVVAPPQRAASVTPAATEHLLEGLHQAVVDRLAEWPRLRVARRAEPWRLANATATLEATGDDVAIAVEVAPRSVTLRAPLEADSLERTADHAARVIAAALGSDAAPPPLRGHPLARRRARADPARPRVAARRDRRMLPDALTWCEQALALAPDHPRVLAALATCEAQLAFFGSHPAPHLLDNATAHAFAALAAAPDLAMAHFARAHVELHHGRPLVAAVCFRAAIARAPLLAEPHEWLGRMLLEAGFAVDARARLDEVAAPDLPALEWDLVIARALEGAWDDVDRTVARLIAVSIDGGRGYRLRLATWRGQLDVARAIYEELAALPQGALLERRVALAIYDTRTPWPERRVRILDALDDDAIKSARRKAFLAQLAAEAAARADDADTCIAMLLRASAYGLFHRPWLDHCPLFERVRELPRFKVIRNDVAARADAIHDALFGDHAQATMATAIG